MCVGQTAEATGTRPLPDDFPNDKYVTRWIAKHPDISVRRSQFLDVKRAESSSADAVMRYFTNLKAVLTELDLLDKPEHIWNCDETGICPQGRTNPAEAKKGVCVDESYSAGVVLNYKMMAAAINAKADAKALKEANKKSAPNEKAAWQAVNLHDKPQARKAKEENAAARRMRKQVHAPKQSNSVQRCLRRPSWREIL
ncbi:hypothetical protein ON010_g9144 [Phytophthora cinnamomi]|nr:hypothetical protein ON010_g9144 [Phytophthora cinnamomi]